MWSFKLLGDMVSLFRWLVAATFCFPLEMQYSDLAEVERASVLEKFRQSTSGWSQNINIHPGDCIESGNGDHKSSMIVVTDACLPSVGSGETSLSARLLINYVLPTKKEAYLRRMSASLAPDGIVINMVVGGEVVALKGIEESCGTVIAELPIDIFEKL